MLKNDHNRKYWGGEGIINRGFLEGKSFCDRKAFWDIKKQVKIYLGAGTKRNKMVEY